jgi:hypothetical protein
MADWPDLLPYFPDPVIREESWAVARFDLTESEIRFAELRDMIHRRRESYGIKPGTYLRLTCGGHTIMSNTPMERATNQIAVDKAHGHVLVGGLGLGWVTLAIAAKREVDHVTVIEKSACVINLVGSRLPANPKVTILMANAYDFRPSFKPDVVYYDIWPNVPNEDDREDMRRLRRHARSFMRRGWIGCWREHG